MSTYYRMTDALADMVQSEHCEGCTEDTCDILAAFESGYALWAIFCFASCGAASEEFDAEYASMLAQYGERFNRGAERERKALCEEIPTMRCETCGSYTFIRDGNAEYYASPDARCGACMALMLKRVCDE